MQGEAAIPCTPSRSTHPRRLYLHADGAVELGRGPLDEAVAHGVVQLSLGVRRVRGEDVVAPNLHRRAAQVDGAFVNVEPGGAGVAVVEVVGARVGAAEPVASADR